MELNKIQNQINRLNLNLKSFELRDNIYLQGDLIVLLYTRDLLDVSGKIKDVNYKNIHIFKKILNANMTIYVYPNNNILMMHNEINNYLEATTLCFNVTKSTNGILYSPYNKEFTSFDIIENPSIDNYKNMFLKMEEIDYYAFPNITIEII